MLANSQVEVVVSNDLWRSLRRQARELGVSLELLAAGLVCDTIHAEAGVHPSGCKWGLVPSPQRRHAGHPDRGPRDARC